jgi:ribonucleoside-triphosphate reductase
VRRSAQLAIGDPDDIEYLLAKRWDLGRIPKWRGMSNNSVACSDVSELHELFWDGYEGKGEPYGLINLDLSRSCGRLGETEYPDPDVEGYNPCAEQSLEPYETCCLAEIFLPNLTSKEEFMDVAELLYRVNKHSLMLPAHHPETNRVVHKNMRMGIGLTGILQASEEQLSWCDDVYKYLRDFDIDYSNKLGVQPSIKLTTIKPSGTLSLLPGVTPGIHPGYAQYMYRRIRIAADHTLVDVCKDHGYPIEYQLNADGSKDFNTVVITFPFSYPQGTVLAKDITAIDQLKLIGRLQSIWSDNSVSCTVYYKAEELPLIKEYLAQHYSSKHKTLSFLLHQGHGFLQAPYEEITKAQFDELNSKTTIISGVADAGELDLDGECGTGGCPVR